MAKTSRDNLKQLQSEFTKNPGSRLFVHLAEAYRQAGDLRQAHELLTQGLRKHKDYPSGMIVLAKVLSDQGEDAKAEGVWRDVLRLDPQNVLALRALGDIAEAAGRRDESMDFYRQVVRLENAEPELAPAESAQAPREEPAAEPVAAAPDPEPIYPVVEPSDAAIDFEEPAELGTAIVGGGDDDDAGSAWDEYREPAALGGFDDEPPPAGFSDPELEAEPAAPVVATLAVREEAVVVTPRPRAAAPPPPPTPAPAPAPFRAPAPAAPRVPAYTAAAPKLPAIPAADDREDRELEGDTGGAVALAEVLVRLLERDGALFRARGSLRRLLAMAAGRELGMDAAQLDGMALAALLGGLGELAAPELQGIEGADAEASRLAAALQLLRGIPLPAGAREAVAYQHEQWDGSGPAGMAGEEIPLPARVLAVAAAAAGLLEGRGAGTAAAALDLLESEAGSAYDPVVVGALRRAFAQRELHGIGHGWGGRIAVAHPDPLRALDLAARLHARGYAAGTAPSGVMLQDQLAQYPPQALVIGAELDGVDPAQLVREIRSAPGLAGLPVVVVDAGDPGQRVGLLGAGADACFAPDTSFPELAASLDALLRRAEAVAAPRM